MHKSQRKFTPENVQLRMAQIRILGKPEPYLYPDNLLNRWRFDEAPEELQKRYWVKLMNYASGRLERW